MMFSFTRKSAVIALAAAIILAVALSACSKDEGAADSRNGTVSVTDDNPASALSKLVQAYNDGNLNAIADCYANMSDDDLAVIVSEEGDDAIYTLLPFGTQLLRYNEAVGGYSWAKRGTMSIKDVITSVDSQLSYAVHIKLPSGKTIDLLNQVVQILELDGRWYIDNPSLLGSTDAEQSAGSAAPSPNGNMSSAQNGGALVSNNGALFPEKSSEWDIISVKPYDWSRPRTFFLRRTKLNGTMINRTIYTKQWGGMELIACRLFSTTIPMTELMLNITFGQTIC